MPLSHHTISMLTNILVDECVSIREAINTMDKAGIGLCVCVNSDKEVVGVFTDGDFRRVVLNNTSLEEKIGTVANKDFIYVNQDYTEIEIKEIFEKSVVQHVPVIENKRLIGLITEEDFFGIKRTKRTNQNLNIPVVIMAGGKGTRMDPFTRILPKALIPIENKPICKKIMDDMHQYGIQDFYLSVYEKSKMIRAYFQDAGLDYKLNYIEESMPLGTAGGIKPLQNVDYDNIFVTNCDIFFTCNYESIFNFHIEQNNDLTLVASMKNYQVPYGVCELTTNGNLSKINEKPEYNMLVNTGLYVLKTRALELIPDNTYFDMTDFISSLTTNNHKVGVFPISDSEWTDVGQWDKYQSYLNQKYE